MDRECPECTRRGYAPDNRWPETAEFWPVRHGRLTFGMCRACRNDFDRNSQARFKRICRKHALALTQQKEAA